MRHEGVRILFVVSVVIALIEGAVALDYVAAGLVHLIPAAAMLSRARVEALYGVSIGTRELEVLLRHRALLFVVVAALLLAAAWRPELRVIAGALGLFSMLGCVVLADQIGTENAALLRVGVAVSVILGAALVAQVLRTTSAGQ